MQEKTQSSQIKGELQLILLHEAVEFITEKFDQYVADRKEKRENYRQFTAESFKNVEWITSTEEFTRSSSSTLDKIASSFTGYQNKKVKTQMSKF